MDEHLKQQLHLLLIYLAFEAPCSAEAMRAKIRIEWFKKEMEQDAQQINDL